MNYKEIARADERARNLFGLFRVHAPERAYWPEGFEKDIAIEISDGARAALEKVLEAALGTTYTAEVVRQIRAMLDDDA